MSGIEPVTPFARASEQAAAQQAQTGVAGQPQQSVTNQIALTGRAPQLAPTADMGNVTSQYSNIPGLNTVKTADMAQFSQAAGLLAEQTVLIPLETKRDERIAHLNFIVNETAEQRVEKPKPEEAMFPPDVHEIHIVQPAEDKTDASRDSGNQYIPLDETENETEDEKIKKLQRRELERRNLILDEAASWKGRGTKMHYSPESLSQASEDLISSFLPFAGLYRFSNS